MLIHTLQQRVNIKIGFNLTFKLPNTESFDKMRRKHFPIYLVISRTSVGLKKGTLGGNAVDSFFIATLNDFSFLSSVTHRRVVALLNHQDKLTPAHVAISTRIIR